MSLSATQYLKLQLNVMFRADQSKQRVSFIKNCLFIFDILATSWELMIVFGIFRDMLTSDCIFPEVCIKYLNCLKQDMIVIIFSTDKI